MKEILWVLAVSALPLSELRGGIPLALALGLPPGEALLWAFLGNLLPIPFLLAFLPRVLLLARKLPAPFGPLVTKYLAWQERHRKSFVRFGPWALFFFVALPLPGTGVWTGALLASLFRIPLKAAIPPLLLGVGVAGILVLLASLGAFRLFGL